MPTAATDVEYLRAVVELGDDVVEQGRGRPRTASEMKLSGPDASFVVEIPKSRLLSNLALREADRVAPGPGEVEVRMETAGLNYRPVVGDAHDRVRGQPPQQSRPTSSRIVVRGRRSGNGHGRVVGRAGTLDREGPHSALS
ncbi:hypothetical protein [Nocardia abscessus]|uniref:Uncharacterized protein n=1 Tax=Nocardia abscessus TaxID=120957 RepID=A0ABS0CG67_9NOCA|nr:hypothetical protein [Nocardia abscessus]MBF6229335.1 hypothetical protein [Nocardia abscessus]